MVKRALLVLAAAVTLTACSPAVADAPTSSTPASRSASTAGAADALPGLRYDRIGVDVDSMIPVGLDPDQRPEVPSEDDPMVIGWYVLGPTPGDPGPAVIAAHVNAGHKSGAFAHLAQAQPGDRLQVQRGGELITFEVYDVTQADKDRFPTELVYGPTKGNRAEVHLITCGGELGVEASGRHSYEDNIIVSAYRV